MHTVLVGASVARRAVSVGDRTAAGDRVDAGAIVLGNAAAAVRRERLPATRRCTGESRAGA
jgi:hypothetical protein